MRIKLKIIPLLLMFLIYDSGIATSFVSPNIGLVLSKTRFEERWDVLQLASHGWCATTTLAGIPYDCLFASELAAHDSLNTYDALIFVQCYYIDQNTYQQLVETLGRYTQNGGNIIFDGPLAVADENGQVRDHGAIDQLFDMQVVGLRGDEFSRMKINSNNHFVTANFEDEQYVTQHLAGKLNIISGAGDVLLNCTNEKEVYPYLTLRKTDKFRQVLISDFGTWSGAASIFRTENPNGFYANRLIELMINVIHWSIYGEISHPYPVPQLSNANMTAMVRLDADISDNLTAQIETLKYLESFSRETGVVPLYAWVSGRAAQAGWDQLAPYGYALEQAGGQIGTHSKTHNIAGAMTDERWQEELDGSVMEIEENMLEQGFRVGPIEWFINPGEEIPQDQYEHIAKYFAFFMTHGPEEYMPLGYGNATWFTGMNKDFVVIEPAPSSDYHWFFFPGWSYSTAQITAYEEAIFDHIYHSIGRGALFNLMWHDYSITSQPQYGSDRIVNEDNRALYDGIKAKYLTHDIYCPDPSDLAQKLRAMAQWSYNWSVNEDRINLVLDLSDVNNDSIADYAAGMGLRIENTEKFIHNVVINDRPHYGFNNRCIILPALNPGVNSIHVSLADQPADEPRLVYISKRFKSITRDEEGLKLKVLTKSKAKFSFRTAHSVIILNADWQRQDPLNPKIREGYVDSNRLIILKEVSDRFNLVESNLTITDMETDEKTIKFSIDTNHADDYTFRFTSDRSLMRATLASSDVSVTKSAKSYHLNIPGFNDKEVLTIQF